MDNSTLSSIVTNLTNAIDEADGHHIFFGLIDYMLFVFMLAISAIIGIYFGCFGKKQETPEEYLLGGKSMSIFPISMSLVASSISGITLLGVPADVYQHGATYWLSVISINIVCVIVAYVYMPVFYTLQLTSCYEYLKLRFNNKTRVLASFLFALATFLYVPIVIYIPALAFAQVSGLNLYLITIVISVICIFYTTLGGLKAVVWTDTLQTLVMVGSMLTIFYLGVYKAGGFGVVWEKAVDGDRLDVFRMNIDPTARDSFWALIIGFSCSWVSYVGVNQSCIQRFLALPTLGDVKKSLFIFAMGIMLFKSASVFSGLIMHAMYADCDPLATGAVSRPDQLLPYHVMDVAADLPGLPGLFIAGVVSAAHSTLSSCLNTLSGTIYQDFLSPFMPKGTTEKTESNVMKCIVVVTGIVSVALVFVIERLGGVFQMSISLSGIPSGPLLGIFTLGMLFPSANAKGALVGGIGSLIFLTWLVIGTQLQIAQGLINHLPKPLSVDNCEFPVLTSPYNATTSTSDDVFIMYRISFYYYVLIGTLAVIIIGLPVSWITSNADDPEVDIDLLSPVIYWLLPEKKVKEKSADYYSVDKAYHIVKELTTI